VRVILDANVLVSAAIRTGASHRIVDAGRTATPSSSSSANSYSTRSATPCSGHDCDAGSTPTTLASTSSCSPYSPTSSPHTRAHGGDGDVPANNTEPTSLPHVRTTRWTSTPRALGPAAQPRLRRPHAGDSSGPAWSTRSSPMAPPRNAAAAATRIQHPIQRTRASPTDEIAPDSGRRRKRVLCPTPRVL